MEKVFFKFFFLEEIDDLDISFRQYIYAHLIHLNIMRLFRSLAFNDKIIFPLPKNGSKY